MARRRFGREEPGGAGDGPPADPVAVAREIALRQLTTRARSRAELAGALESRGVPQEAAGEVLDRFAEVGLINDSEFAREWAQSRQRGGRSARVISRELRDKGVDADVVADTMADLDPEADLFAAREVARKKLRTLASAAPDARYRRLAGALARRGFSSAVVARVVSESIGGHRGDQGD